MESPQPFSDPTDQRATPVPEIDPARCDGCGLCVRVCPANVLAIRAGLAAVVRPEDCAYHGHCERICPKTAISRQFQIIFNPKKETAHEARFDP